VLGNPIRIAKLRKAPIAATIATPPEIASRPPFRTIAPHSPATAATPEARRANTTAMAPTVAAGDEHVMNG
jgi:hypothetical protein